MLMVVTRRISEDGDDEEGYDEQHQFNVRAIYAIENIADVGVSFQYGLLKATNVGDDENGSHYAFSTHMKNSYAALLSFHSSPITTILSLTKRLGAPEIRFSMGAYDFPDELHLAA